MSEHVQMGILATTRLENGAEMEFLEPAPGVLAIHELGNAPDRRRHEDDAGRETQPIDGPDPALLLFQSMETAYRAMVSDQVPDAIRLAEERAVQIQGQLSKHLEMCDRVDAELILQGAPRIDSAATADFFAPSTSGVQGRDNANLIKERLSAQGCVDPQEDALWFQQLFCIPAQREFEDVFCLTNTDGGSDGAFGRATTGFRFVVCNAACDRVRVYAAIKHWFSGWVFGLGSGWETDGSAIIEPRKWHRWTIGGIWKRYAEAHGANSSEGSPLLHFMSAKNYYRSSGGPYNAFAVLDLFPPLFSGGTHHYAGAWTVPNLANRRVEVLSISQTTGITLPFLPPSADGSQCGSNVVPIPSGRAATASDMSALFGTPNPMRRPGESLAIRVCGHYSFSGIPITVRYRHV